MRIKDDNIWVLLTEPFKNEIVPKLSLQELSRLPRSCRHFNALFQEKINVQQLLKWVYEGHLVEVENLLKKDPKLVLATGTVTDLFGQIFKKITAFQYAAWAFDMQMCKLILKYLDGSIAALQLKALENYPDVYSPHGAHYDFMLLIDKTQAYLDNYCSWDYDERCNYWQKEVGVAQQLCPAWLIYAWCEKGENTAWVKQDFQNYPVNRQYSEDHLNYWFTRSSNGRYGVDSNLAVERPSYSNCIRMCECGGEDSDELMMGYVVHPDIINLKILKAQCLEQLEQLRVQLDQSSKNMGATELFS